LEIHTGLLVREILVFGTRYVTSVAKQWNDVFGLLEATQLAALAVEAVNFNFDPAQTRF
jgi:hypothetical protein